MKLKLTLASMLVAWHGVALAGGAAPLPPGWRAAAPREEIRPQLAFEPRGGPDWSGSLVITHDDREGLDGWFERTFPVRGGACYGFRAVRKTRHVSLPRRSALVRVCWQDDRGQMVSADVSEQQVKELGHVPSAEPEFPTDGPTDPSGWTTVSGTYRAPSKATQAVVELHLQWAPEGRIEWSNVQFGETAGPVPRRARLATVHYRPSGKSPRENCEEFAPLLAEAARQKADLVVLGETVPAVGIGKQAHELAEPVPGPTTDYFAGLAGQSGPDDLLRRLLPRGGA